MAEEISYTKLIPAFHFEVTFVTSGTDVENLPAIAFSEVSGIGIELQTEDIQEGGGNNYTIRLPKPPKFKNLVLKRAMSATPPVIIEWAMKAVDKFEFTPLTVLVSIKDYGDNAVKTWSFENAYPVKLIVSELSASKNEAVIETLELAYRRFELVS